MSPENNKKAERPVRTILVLLVLACLLPGVIGAALFFIHEYRAGRAQLDRNMQQTVRALGQAVDNHLMQGLAIAQALSASETLQQGDLAKFHSEARRTIGQARLGTNVVLRSRDGPALLNTLVDYGRPLPPGGGARVREVFDTGRPTISNLFTGPVSGLPVLSVDVPVRIRGDVVYALSVGILPQDLSGLLKAQGLPPEWVVGIVDAAGTIVSRSRAPEQAVGKQSTPEFKAALRRAREGSIKTLTVDGIPVVSYFNRSAATDWTVVAGIPQAVLESSANKTLVTLAAGTGALFLIGLLLAWFIGGRIAFAVKALIGPAAALGEGSSAPMPQVAVKEAAEVAAAIGRAGQLLDERADALRAREAELAEAHRLARFGTWLWDLRTGAVQTSESIRAIFGRDVPPFAEQRGTLLSIETWDKVNAAAQEALQTGKGFDLEIMINQDTGNPIWINARCEAVRDESLQVVALRGTVLDITERKLSEQRIRDAALHDPLTGLPNRSFVFEYCAHLLAAAGRGHGHGALLFIDLDRFKPVNDLYGHDVGDRLLQEVAARLRACSRREDLVGRLGGDEFVIVLPFLAIDPHRAAVVAESVVEAIARPFSINSMEIAISPSIGISFFPEHATEVGTLLHCADLAMYHAKQAGRANYQFYSPELDRRASHVLSVEVRLKNALKHGHLKLNYQPVIDIQRNRVIGAEALARLQDGDGEPLGPDIFIPIAESAGLILELGEWVLAEVCRQQKSWADAGLLLNVAFNVSPLQFRQRAFAERLRGIIAQTGIDPVRLEIEVTESAVMTSVEEAIDILNRIKALGVRVALDDFGTGYSSLSSLSNFPLDKLKIDQSFVRRIERDPASRAVTEAILALGRSLRLNVAAEGIESAEVLRYLKEHGCDQAQGFWFSQPMAPAEFAEWYQARHGRERIEVAQP